MSCYFIKTSESYNCKHLSDSPFERPTTFERATYYITIKTITASRSYIGLTINSLKIRHFQHKHIFNPILGILSFSASKLKGIYLSKRCLLDGNSRLHSGVHKGFSSTYNSKSVSHTLIRWRRMKVNSINYVCR